MVIVATDTPEHLGKKLKHVIKNANCDVGVLVLPADRKPRRINKVLCSLLRTKNDQYVVNYATMMAQSKDLHVLLLHLNKPGSNANQKEINKYTGIATEHSSMKV